MKIEIEEKNLDKWYRTVSIIENDETILSIRLYYIPTLIRMLLKIQTMIYDSNESKYWDEIKESNNVSNFGYDSDKGYAMRDKHKTALRIHSNRNEEKSIINNYLYEFSIMESIYAIRCFLDDNKSLVLELYTLDDGWYYKSCTIQGSSILELVSILSQANLQFNLKLEREIQKSVVIKRDELIGKDLFYHNMLYAGNVIGCDYKRFVIKQPDYSKEIIIEKFKNLSYFKDNNGNSLVFSE